MRRRARGFTLVELLVVIGIIALLISILLPALNSARRQAATVKCLSNLRQIGNAFAMYAGDNKGTWPVTVWRDGDVNKDYFYATDGSARTSPRPWYWHMFLQKYLNSKIARDTATVGDRDYIEKNNVLWGCPEWRPWQDAGFTGGINLDEVGYGMNWCPTYRGDFPSATNPDTGTISPQDPPGTSSTVCPIFEHRAYRQTGAYGNKPGRFFRQVEWHEPAERGLICDSEYFTPALDAPPDPDGLPQAQPLHIYQNYGSYNLDFYRHGKPPRPASATKYQKTGGKVGVNMLFCDGHAATLNTFGDMYLALRRKYPG